MNHDLIKKEYQKLLNQLQDIETRLRCSPEGNLVISHEAAYSKWYHRLASEKYYIPKANRQLAEKLAAKKYLSLLREELLLEKKALEAYLRLHPAEPTYDKIQRTASPEFLKLLAPHFKPLSSELSEWASAAFDTNLGNPEHLIHKTSSGIYVRSKSEALIATLLSAQQIPFRYECALRLGQTILYPDFTIRHPQTGSFYYWEHFGMMEHDGYCRNIGSKLQLYCTHDIIPGVNLLLSFESMKHPLDTSMVQDMIHRFFLT